MALGSHEEQQLLKVKHWLTEREYKQAKTWNGTNREDYDEGKSDSKSATSQRLKTEPQNIFTAPIFLKLPVS